MKVESLSRSLSLAVLYVKQCFSKLEDNFFVGRFLRVVECLSLNRTQTIKGGYRPPLILQSSEMIYGAGYRT
jgi:hypothetical protein